MEWSLSFTLRIPVPLTSYFLPLSDPLSLSLTFYLFSFNIPRLVILF